jgi:hypothetical protein
MKNLLIGWLAAQGIVLANDASDQSVVAAVQKAATKSKEEATALGNGRDSASSQVVALTNERDNLKTALSNEQAATKAERKSAAILAVDLAIQRGRKTVAERDAAITALENSKDFAADSGTLLAGKAVVKISGQSTESGKVLANDEEVALHNEYNKALQMEMIATGQDIIKAHRNVMTKPEYSGLAAKLAPKSPR